MTKPVSKEKEISQYLIYTYVILMILTGSINTIANKLQNISIALDIKYKHDWFITFCMFLGECFCLIVYYPQKWFFTPKNIEPLISHVDNINLIDNELIKGNGSESTEEENSQKKIKLPEASPFQLMIPALCDFCGSTLMTIGLSMISSSIYQMLRGSLIIFTTIFSRIFLKNKVFRHNLLGIGSILLGLILVGLAAFTKDISPSCPQDESDNIALGFSIVIIAQLFSATQFIVEENFMKKYDCDPLKVVGWEGVWGALFYIIVLIVAQNIECSPPLNKEANFATLVCFRNGDGVYLLEDTLFALKQLGDNGMLLFYCILYICSIGVFNFVGISISKLLTSAARSVIDTIRTILVWLFFLFPIVSECNREKFQVLQLIGFIFLILGTIIYKEILTVPFFGLDKFTKKKLQLEQKSASDS